MYMRGGNWKKNDRTGNAWRKGYFSVIGEIYVLRINDNFFFFFGLVMWRTKQSNRHIAITLSYYEKNKVPWKLFTRNFVILYLRRCFLK